MNHVPEQALLLGPANTLVGVITPAAPGGPQEPPFVVMLNAGIIHRVGPNRLHVTMARALSAAGFPVLRVDLSGLGDSPPREDGLAPLDAAMADIRDILDTLQATRQVDRFVLMGLCSGADHSVIHAADDPRVAGLVLLDPSIPRTPGFHLRYYARRLFSLRSWGNLLLGRHPVWQRLRGAPGGPDEADALSAAEQRPAVTLEHPEVRAFLTRAYGGAMANGVHCLAVLTADRERQHNYPGQLVDAFPSVDFGNRLTVEYYERCDHTFTTLANQQRLTQQVQQWLTTTRWRSGG